MRFFVITFFLLFTIAFSATAQNFQPFRNKFKYQFTYLSAGPIFNSVTTKIHGIEVDSAALISGDSIFYFNKINSEDNFWGNSMAKKSGGEYLFLISNFTQNDTLIVKTQEPIGTQWTFRLDNILYTARYEKFRQETVLTNQTDYVKTFIVENASGFKDSIKISERFGLIYSFPFSNLHYINPSNFNLTYIYNTKLGVDFLNYFEYFNYELGDVLEYTPNYYVVAGYPDKTGGDIYKVISKTISVHADTVSYILSKCHISHGGYIPTPTHCEIIVTEYSVTHNISYFVQLTFPTNKNDGFLEYSAQANNLIRSNAPYVFEGASTYIYIKGLGCYKHTTGATTRRNEVFYQNILYINQSNIDDDCAFIETIIDTKTLHASSSNLVIAPNPFDQSIALTATNLIQGNWTVRITSALGVEVYTSKMIISSSDQKIDLSNLPALTSGIYFLSLENESQVYSQKIVKQ